ncbi:MAG: AbrB/MazE/SpoVT family DNA-binding domain-containing protein, partial [Panacagrimonas sp.]
MESVESKITSKGQISVPAAVRRQLALGPGARIEWVEKDGEVVVRRASRFSSQEIH